MELLPIIYTTLLIVAALAVVVIIFSFIAFKIRKSAKEENKPAVVPHTPPQIKKVSSQNKEVKTSSPDQKVVIKRHSSKSHPEKSARDKKRVDEKPKQKPIKPRKERIEILNKTKTEDSFTIGQHPRTSSKRMTVEKPDNNDSGLKNYLDNYEDKNGKNFHPLN